MRGKIFAMFHFWEFSFLITVVSIFISNLILTRTFFSLQFCKLFGFESWVDIFNNVFFYIITYYQGKAKYFLKYKIFFCIFRILFERNTYLSDFGIFVHGAVACIPELASFLFIALFPFIIGDTQPVSFGITVINFIHFIHG